MKYNVFHDTFILEVMIMITYKINVLETLKEAGYNTGRLRNEKLLGENAIQSIRHNEMVGMKALDQICTLLDMQPGNIIKYVDNEKTLEKM